MDIFADFDEGSSDGESSLSSMGVCYEELNDGTPTVRIVEQPIEPDHNDNPSLNSEHTGDLESDSNWSETLSESDVDDSNTIEAQDISEVPQSHELTNPLPSSAANPHERNRRRFLSLKK